MSNQWEVVTKSKKAKNLEKKISQSEQKRLLESAGPKLEEILPSHQLKTILSKASKANKENKSPASNGKVSPKTGSKSSSPKKSQKTVNNNNEQPKFVNSTCHSQPKAKNFEAALKTIKPSDLEGEMQLLKNSYPGSELLWLKGIASYLNSHLNIDTDPTFAGKSYHYPSNVVPSHLRTALIDILKSVGEVNVSYFYDQLLTSLASDLSKNQVVLGYKVLLQLIAQNWPHVCANNLAKTAILRNSYQNRSNVGLSILWALGQGGYQDLTTGIKVFQNIMVPVIEMKAYTKFVCEYIEKILKTAENQKINLIQNEFFVSYNALKLKYSIPRESQQILTDSSSLLLKLYIKNSTKPANIFTNLFRGLENAEINKSEIEACIECLNKGDDCFRVWLMNYKKNVLPSYLLLNQIYLRFEDLAVPLSNSNNLNKFLLEAARLNLELDCGKKRDPNLDNLLSLFTTVQEKSTQHKKRASGKQSSSCCKWLFGSLLLIGAIGGLIAYDTHLNGGVFEKSSTGKALKDAGLLPHAEKAWYTTMSTSARGYKWAEKHVPVYAKPALDLTCDLYKVVRNGACTLFSNVKEYAIAKRPTVEAFVEQYIPGLPKKSEEAVVKSADFLVTLYNSSRNYFTTKVFVGVLSPENLGKALNQTQTAAAQYYSWFNQKVDTYAKLQ